MDNIIKSQALDFLICCYFGQSKDLVKAAIDKAYVDMASHTLKGFKEDEYERKWECRYNAYECIRNGVRNYPNNKTDFRSWHASVISELKKKYIKPKLEEGQAQKWLNMTIKYLYIFKILLGEDDDRLTEIKSFMQHTSEKDYKMPVDSYVLKGVGIDDATWSTLNEEGYQNANERIKEKIGNDIEFLWELMHWEEFAEKYRSIDKNSYAEYCIKKEKDK